MITKPVVDYRRFRWNRRTDPEFSHLKYLLFWPVFGFFFLVVERIWIRPVYFPVSCSWDARIPFCEYFLIPYEFWFVYLVGMHIYTLLYDVESFRKLERFIILTYSAAMIIYILFPNCQQLRPESFPRDNFLTRFLTHFYAFDTNTNVFPSIHVIGSVAVAACAWNSRRFSTTAWRIGFTAVAVLISISTVFVKQHSVLDVLAGAAVCIPAYWLVYCRPGERRKGT